MNFNETLRSVQQSIESLARQFQGVARDVEELKKGKGIDTIKERVGDNLGGVYSPYHQRAYDNNPNVGQSNFGGYYDGQQGDKALDKIKWKVGFSKTTFPSSRNVVHKPQTSTYKSRPKKDETPKVAFKDNSKPKVEEKGRLIINPTRYFKCNDVGHIFINYPT
ncbi:hypothetical protein M9H77_13892 [Catharanthus roseus]|uniref:Uncharacterized protein n=1 Tax=Catharanthus roseus TaxID=4058 RepID=A0ACC0BLQ7_CATRO|nr:hypothetical protein M9H77_13892 [Catharanthus roseus]